MPGFAGKTAQVLMEGGEISFLYGYWHRKDSKFYYLLQFVGGLNAKAPTFTCQGT